MKHTCQNCHVEFSSKRSNQKYCSRECFYKAQEGQNLVTLDCEICGKPFGVKPYRKNTARFCSPACGGKWHMQNRVMRGPSLVGNKLRKGLKPTNAFTTEQVAGENNPKWVDPVVFVCEGCGREFGVKPWIVRQNGGRKYCTKDCMLKNRPIGEAHHFWRGGQETYRGKGWKSARLKAVRRDNGTCQHCGKEVGRSIPVHHIRPFREFADIQKANALDNLICLCQSCHMKAEWSQSE